MLDVQTAVLANQAMNYLMSGRTPQRQAPPINIMPRTLCCRDGDVVIAVGNDGQFAKMLGGRSLTSAAIRFASTRSRAP